MLAKRIIPCLDVRAGRVVKGVNFLGLRDAGDPVELAIRYNEEGADELVFLDISATLEERESMHETIRQVAEKVFIPFTVGGGIHSVESAAKVILAGADKVGVNSAAIQNPNVLSEIAARFGEQAVVLAIDATWSDGHWMVTSHSGTRDTGLDAIEWAIHAANAGAGEILLTSMDADGVRTGFNIALTQFVADAVPIPVIASGGAGSAQDFVKVFQRTRAEAALAASIFHEQHTAISEVKRALTEANIPVRRQQ
ncbi:MAG: imidazole glycerol phosphate synthase subunit HisF [Armatimonadetes bacterium]|nr:imidazole glycerol phosphate synthase subunit HisF [Armatimonadota bacterium]